MVVEDEEDEGLILASSAIKAGARVFTMSFRSDCSDRDWTTRGKKIKQCHTKSHYFGRFLGFPFYDEESTHWIKPHKQPGLAIKPNQSKPNKKKSRLKAHTYSTLRA